MANQRPQSGGARNPTNQPSNHNEEREPHARAAKCEKGNSKLPFFQCRCSIALWGIPLPAGPQLIPLKHLNN